MGHLGSLRLQWAHRRRTPLRRRPVRFGNLRNPQQRRLSYHHWSRHYLIQHRNPLLFHLHRTGRQRRLPAHMVCSRLACGTGHQRRYRCLVGHTLRFSSQQRHHDQRHHHRHKRIRHQFRTPSLHSLSLAPLSHRRNNHRPRSVRGQAQRLLCRRHKHYLLRNRLRRPDRPGNLRSICLGTCLSPRTDCSRGLPQVSRLIVF